MYIYVYRYMYSCMYVWQEYWSRHAEPDGDELIDLETEPPKHNEAADAKADISLHI